jgi:hypothetical protein
MNLEIAFLIMIIKKKKKQLNINLNKFYQDFSKILKYILRKDIYKY